MIRDRLRRLAADALRRIEEERDASQVRVYTAPWVIDGDGVPILDGAIVFDMDGQVLALGEASTLLPEFRWAQRAELDGILMPGLVNAQTELDIGQVDEPLPRGLGVRRSLRALREIRRATERLDPDSREARIRAAVRRSVDAGTAAVGDVTDSLRAVPAMSREGLYGIVFHELHESSGRSGEFSARRFAKAVAAAAVQKAGVAPWPEGILYRLAPHFGEVAAVLLDELAAVGADPKGSIDQLGGLHERLMPSHLGNTTPESTQASDDPSVVLCPRAVLHETGSLPPLVSFLEQGCRVALGTESSATAPDGSVLREAAELHAAYPEVPAMVLIRAATSGGADALGLDTVGSFTPGAAPGLLRVDTNGLVPDDPCGWILRAGDPQLSWLVRPGPPAGPRAA